MTSHFALTPFAQGYIEAMFANSKDWPGRTFEAFRDRGYRPVAFADLAPETLAAILKDCARFEDQMTAPWPDAAHGADFWFTRQGGQHDRFPPLTPYLGDDGKVRFQ